MSVVQHVQPGVGEQGRDDAEVGDADHPVVGTGQDEQIIDGLIPEYSKKFTLHYYFPPFATGEAKPCGEKQVRSGEEKPFLAPLSVRKIPMIGAKTYTMLANMGVSRVFTLQQMEPTAMHRIFGANGITIWKKPTAWMRRPSLPIQNKKVSERNRLLSKIPLICRYFGKPC